MTKSTIIFLSIFLIASAFSDEVDNEDNVVVDGSVGTEAIPLEKVPAEYPRKAQSAGIEGWVTVSFVVNQDGTNKEMTILDTSIEGYFEKEAIRAVKTWTYTPATWNGLPVTQAKNTARLIFTFSDSNRGVSRYFHSRYKKAREALQNEDLETAKRIIDKLDKSSQKLLAEVCFLDVLKGGYWQKNGDPSLALRHYSKALIIASDAVPEATYIHVLRQAIVLNIQQGNYASALSQHKTLLEEDQEFSPVDPINKYITQVRQILESDTPFPTNGKITKPCLYCNTIVPSWNHTLLRNQFTITEVKGEISELLLLCGFQMVTIDYEPDLLWNVNKDWGECNLRVLGAEGTTFKLVEY